MIKFITLTAVLFLSSCIQINRGAHTDETLPVTPEQKKNREAVAMQERDLQRNSLGYFKKRHELSRTSIGTPNGFLALGTEEEEYRHRFFIKAVCGDSSQFTAPPLRYANFDWVLSDSLKGSTQSDQDGIIEFTMKTKNSIDFKQVQIGYKGQSFVVKTAPANMILSIPQNLCRPK